MRRSNVWVTGLPDVMVELDAGFRISTVGPDIRWSKPEGGDAEDAEREAKGIARLHLLRKPGSRRQDRILIRYRAVNLYLDQISCLAEVDCLQISALHVCPAEGGIFSVGAC